MEKVIEIKEMSQKEIGFGYVYVRKEEPEDRHIVLDPDLDSSGRFFAAKIIKTDGQLAIDFGGTEKKDSIYKIVGKLNEDEVKEAIQAYYRLRCEGVDAPADIIDVIHEFSQKPSRLFR
jgi:hypothetical protein